jgi:uncharacterized GH25 family protein
MRPPIRFLLRTSGLCSIVFLAAHNVAVCWAHDLWLVPPKQAEMSSATVRASSGTEFPISHRAPDTSKFKRKLVILPDKRESTIADAGVEGDFGLMKFDAPTPGVYVIAVETEPKLITLAADEFNSYLVSDGLSHIYQLRRQEGILDQPGRERYSKSPKALFRVGRGGKGDPCRAVGLPLEIVPFVSPFTLKAGDTLPVRVLFRDKPLGDANLGWDLPGDGKLPAGTVRTDDQGAALIPIRKSGLMTIRLTHMTRPKVADYDWESFWTTLTFEIP